MRRVLLNYVIAIVAVTAAVLLRWLLDPLIGNDLPLVTLFGAVAVAVWVGGAGPAILVTILGYVACAWLFVEPRGALGLDEMRTVVGLVAYLTTCSIIVGIGQAMRTARHGAKERNEALRVTLESIGDAVLTTDAEGRVAYLNPIAESLTGWTLDEARGRRLDEVFRILKEDDRQPAENPVNRVLRDGVVTGLANHTLLIARDGTERPIDDSAAPMRDEDGVVTGCALVFRDISLRRRLERAESARMLDASLLASIVESSDDAIISKSLGGIIQTWNAAAERVFGYTAEEAVGRHITLIIPPDRIAEEDEIIASLRAGQRVEHFETERVRKDGQRIYVSLTVSPVRTNDGRIIGASKIARDVTDRRRLEDSVRRLAVDLAEVDRRKNEFLATLSHELRNPLAPMRNMLEVLKRSGGDAQAFGPAIDTLERQLGQLVRLVDDLLDLNRITYNRLELRKANVELASVIHQAGYAGLLDAFKIVLHHAAAFCCEQISHIPLCQ